jgi:outer membrane receptor protein involved in Fe transport
VLLGGAALASIASSAHAADARLRVFVSARPYAEALIDLGLQANVSILGTSSCGAGGRVSLRGTYTLRQALDQLLEGAPCTWRLVDARTVRISPVTPTPAPAAPMEPPRPPTLVTEVVVTATKRLAALDRLPAGVSAISRDQIEATRAVDVGQTVGQLAGVLTTNLGPGRDKLLIRGLSDGAFTGRTRSTVGTYLDDAPINYNAPDPDLRLADIDRVEVVRGPQGALYGSGAIAGIYRIVTAKPDLGMFEAGALAGLATTKGGDISHELEGYVNLPLSRDLAGLRLVAYRDVQGGYLDDVNLSVANVDKTRRNGGRLALRVRLGDDWRLDALAAAQNLRSNDTQYVTPGITAGLTGTQRANRVREAHNNDFSYGGLTANGEFEWGSVTSSVSYVHHVFSSQYDASAALDIFGARGTDLGVYTEATRSNMLVQDLVIRSPDTGSISWLAGVYAARTRERSPSALRLLSPVTDATAYMENRRDRLTEVALYGEGGLVLGGGWTLTAGGRVFESRVRTTADIVVNAPFASRFFDQARTFNGVSPKVSVQWESAGGDLIYALVSEGYRPGGFNSSGFFPIRQSRTTFRPDQLRNYEVGAKLRRLDGRLAVRAAAYYGDWSNIQTDQYRASGLPFTANVGDARIIGLEAEVGYEWPSGFALQANGLISNAKVRNPNFDFAAQVSTDLPGVPETSGGLLAVYQRPVSDRVDIRLLAEASYVGRTTLSFDASLPPRTDPYLRLNLAAELAYEGWRLSAYVNNPLNDKADTFAYGNPFSFGQVRQVTPQRPRTAGVRLGRTF